MLVLTRIPGQNLDIELKDGTIITVTVVHLNNKKVKLGFTAPLDVQFIREEAKDKTRRTILQNPQ